MKTNVDFIVRRSEKTDRGNGTKKISHKYLTGSHSWSTDKAKAQRFWTRKEAELELGVKTGEIIEVPHMEAKP
jgi:hypothetical protein